MSGRTVGNPEHDGRKILMDELDLSDPPAQGTAEGGEGDGEDPSSNTVIIGMGNVPQYRSVLIAGGGDKNHWAITWGARASISSELVPLGGKQFEVDDASEFKVGDNVVLVKSDDWDIMYGIKNGDKDQCPACRYTGITHLSNSEETDDHVRQTGRTDHQ